MRSSLVTAIDLRTGVRRWQTYPPGVAAGEFTVVGSVVKATAVRSDHKCEFDGVEIDMDLTTGRVLHTAVEQPATIQSVNPPVVESGFTVTYQAPVPSSSAVTAPAGSGFAAAAAPVDLPSAAQILPGGVVKTPSQPVAGESSGLVGASPTGRVRWADTMRGEDGPTLLQPPAHGDGVVAANLGTRDDADGPRPSTVLLLDVRTGAVLWQVPQPRSSHALTIDPPLAYALTSGRLEAHSLHTGAVRWSVPSNARVLATDSGVVVTTGPSGPTVAYDSGGRALWTLRQGIGFSSTGLGAGGGLAFLATSGKYASSCDG